MTLLKMACNRRKKTILYSLCLGALVYMGVQVVYFSETFTPLMMLSDAQSEASRLLKFISLYHYQCNSTVQLFNRTDWPVCTDRKYGVDLDSKGPRIAYSIGPSWDFAFERNLVYNHSYHLFIFSLEDIPRDLKETNRTHYYKTMIVANDPADFGRNSYGTNTLNSVMEAFHHRHLDLLKIDRLADRSHAYELLYYMAEDHILQRVQQLHITVHIDKLDDDYLYRWYRAFYNLFYMEGFRLYHTAASDSLCLQVTMMESCVYYTSWIRNPGPKVFVLHPPAIDGAVEFEEQRLVDNVETVQAHCSHRDTGTSSVTTTPESGPPWGGMAYCATPKDESSRCIVVTISAEPITVSPILSGRKCELISLSLTPKLFTEPHIIMTLMKHRRILRIQSDRKELSFKEAASILRGLRGIDWMYLDLSTSFSTLITPLLDSGLLQDVRQIGMDLILSAETEDRHAIGLRRMFSELRRLEAQGFQIFHSTNFHSSELHYVSPVNSPEHCCYRISYISTKQTTKRK